MDNVALITNKYKVLSERLDEATLRLWAAVEAQSLGRGGVSTVAKAIGISRATIYAGLSELDSLELAPVNPSVPKSRVRNPGGGRKRLVDKDPSLPQDLEKLVDIDSRGDPMSLLRWTCKSTPRLAKELEKQGHKVSQRTVCDLLTELGIACNRHVKRTKAESIPTGMRNFNILPIKWPPIKRLAIQ